MEDNFIKNIVAFCILMENNGGILEKSPGYILEKAQRYLLSSDPEAFKWGLDPLNAVKLSDWITRWIERGGEK